MKQSNHIQISLMILISMGLALLSCNQTTPQWVLDGGFIEKVPPELLAITVDSETQLTLVFSEPIQREGAEQVSNFVVVPDLSILEADLESDDRTIVLVTATHTPGESYQLTVSAIKDLVGNVIQPPNNRKTFTGFGSAAVSVSYLYNPVVYTINQAVEENIPTITGGTPTAFSISPPLPDGLTLDSETGIVSGVPSVTAEEQSYTVSITFSSSSVQKVLQITVLPEAPQDFDYTQPIAVYGIGIPITPNAPASSVNSVDFSTRQDLPAGLSLDPLTGIISGTPTTEAEQMTYIIQACNAAGCAYGGVNIKVVADPPVLAVSDTLFELGKVYYVSGMPSPTLNLDVSNTGVASLDWVATWDGAIVSNVSPALEIGLAGSGGTTNLTVQLDYSGLVDGVHTGEITIRSTTEDVVDNPQVITITFDLKAWGSPYLISTSGYCSAFYPSDLYLKKLSNGDFLIIYEDFDGTGLSRRFRYTIFDPALETDSDCGRIGFDFLINYSQQLAVDVNNNGQAIVAYEGENFSSQYRTVSHRFNIGDSPCWTAGEPIDINPPIVQGIEDFHTAAINDNGEAVVAYIDEGRLYANYFDGSIWGGSQIIDSIDSYPTQFIFSSLNTTTKSVMFPDGSCVVIWIQGTPYKIWANYYSGGTWQGSQLIEAVDDVTYLFDITLLNDGTLALVFRQDNNNVYYRTFDGISWSSPEIISGSYPCSWRNVSLTSNANGEMMLVYISTTAQTVLRMFDGTSWLEPYVSPLIDFGNFYIHSMVLGNDGKAMISYGRQVIYYDGTSWSPPQDFVSNGCAASVNRDDSGNFWLLYIDGSSENILLRKFQP